MPNILRGIYEKKYRIMFSVFGGIGLICVALIPKCPPDFRLSGYLQTLGVSLIVVALTTQKLETESKQVISAKVCITMVATLVLGVIFICIIPFDRLCCLIESVVGILVSCIFVQAERADAKHLKRAKLEG